MTNGPNISKKNRIVQNPLKYQTESAAHIPTSLLMRHSMEIVQGLGMK